MTKASVEDFRGEAPARQSELLTARYAEAARNCKLNKGSLRPYRSHTLEATPSKVGTKLTIYKWGTTSVYFWFHWITDVNAVRGPIAQDTSERTYYTGDGIPKMTYAPIATSGGGTGYPNNYYALGVPAPITAPVVAAVNGTGNITGATKAAPVVITDPAHGLATGTVVSIASVGGMTELNGRTFQVTVLTADTFSLQELNGADVDGLAYTTYTSGGTWTVNSAATPEEDKLSRAYVYTYVSALGEEGAPSDPSTVIDVSPGQTVNLSVLLTGPVSGGPFNLSTKRIYRLTSANDGAAYQFVAEISLATTTYSDTLTDSQLGEVLPALLNDPPPSDLAGLLLLPNGVMAGFSKNNLCVTLESLPHAWPILYRKQTAKPIVAIGCFGTSVVVITEEDAYLANGSDPQAITLERLKISQSCSSKRSCISVGLFGVIYASPDGLVLIGSGEAKLVTDPWIDRDTWQSLVPSSIHAYYHDGMYFGFYDTGSVQGGFIFDPADDGIGFVFIDGVAATAGYADPLTDILYLQIGSQIRKWDSDLTTNLTYRWRSKRFNAKAEVNFSAAEVIARSYANLTFRLYQRVGTTGAITGITKASLAVITSASHGLTTNDSVVLTGIGGMTQMNNRVEKVTVINANSFSVAVNSSAFSNYTSGGSWVTPTEKAPTADHPMGPVYQGAVISRFPFRLPPVWRSSEFQLEFEGTDTVIIGSLAESIKGLKAG